jgi:hypothetical protein
MISFIKSPVIALYLTKQNFRLGAERILCIRQVHHSQVAFGRPDAAVGTGTDQQHKKEVVRQATCNNISLSFRLRPTQFNSSHLRFKSKNLALGPHTFPCSPEC